MQLKPGTRLRSSTCDTEVIVIRADGDSDVDLTCGGVAMTTDPGTPRTALIPGHDAGSLLGKRYSLGAADELELLVTRGGAGALAVGSTLLALKEARALPSSD